MATKRITSEDLVLNLILNADKVTEGNNKLINELYRLDRATRDLEIQLNKLERDKRNLPKSTANYKQQVAALDAQMQKLKEQINSNRAAMMKLRESIGVTGMTINQLRSYLQALRIQRDNATDPRIIRQLNAEIQKVSLRVERMTTGMSRMAQSWRQMGTLANKFGTLIGYVTIAIFAMSRAIMGTTKNLRTLDREFSEVMKTTGLSREEVQRLKREFDELNKIGLKTPTKTHELLSIARIAGRLGVRGVEDIKNFTLAVDKMYVALGKDLEGDIEEITEKVGKLVNVFNLTDEMPLDEALLRAGSLINELGKRSAANAETILNYTARLGGVGSMAGFTIDQLAALGATMDANGVKAERGSTALVKLIVGIGKYADEFARVLGYNAEEFKKRVEEDINGVLIELIERSNKGEKSIINVFEAMDMMHVSGVRVAETFGKLQSNIKMLREQQDIAKTAFSSSASVMNEYYIISQDFDALMAIQGKRVKALADDYSKAMAPALYKVYRGLIDFAYWLKNVFQWLKNHNKILGITISLYALFKATAIGGWIKSLYETIYVGTLYLWDHVKALVANNIALKTMRSAYVNAGGGIKGMIAALQALNKTFWSNPWTAAVAVVASLAAIFFTLKKNVDDVTKAISSMTMDMGNQTREMKNLFDQTMAAAEGTEERANGIKIINELYGEYLPKLLTEADSNKILAESYEYANIKLREHIALKYKNDKYEEIVSRMQERRSKKMSKVLATIGKEQGAYTEGQAMFELDQLVNKIAENDERFEKDKVKALLDYIRKGKNYEDIKGFFEKDVDEFANYSIQEQLDILDSYKKWIHISEVSGFKQIKNKFDQLANSETMAIRQDFLDKWNPYSKGNLITKQDIIDLVNLRRDEMSVENRLNATIEGFLGGVKTGITAEGKPKEPRRITVTKEEFDMDMEALENQYNEELLLIMQNSVDKEQQRKLELKAEQDYLEKKLALIKEYNTAYVEIAKTPEQEKFYQEGWKENKTYETTTIGTEQYYVVPTGGQADILEAQMELQKNLMNQQSAFDALQENFELQKNNRSLQLMKKFGKDKEALKLKELKNEEVYLQDMLDLTIQKWSDIHGKLLTDENGRVLIEAEKQILDARLKLEENRIAQMEAMEKDGTKKQQKTLEEKAKEELLQQKVLMMKLLDEKKITQVQHDTFLLQMEEDFYVRMIAIAKSKGLEYLDWEEKFYETRQKIRENYDEQSEIINKGMKYVTEWYTESIGVKSKDEEQPDFDKRAWDWVEKYNDDKKRIRRFLGLDKSQELEAQFAIFETEDFAGQLAQLEDWYNNAVILDEEYNRRVNEVHRNAWNKRLEYAGEFLGAINQVLGAAGNYFAAQKEQELKVAGNNKKKQLEITQKYAKKEQDIAAAQALIAGALSIMRIWEAKATGNAIADVIVKGILTAAMVATTAIQLKTIRSQQFEKGRYPLRKKEKPLVTHEWIKEVRPQRQYAGGTYPVLGADDKKTYQAQWVGAPKTGIYNKPSLGLFSENKPEMVIDYPTLRNIQMNNPQIIEAILMHRENTPSSSRLAGYSPSDRGRNAGAVRQYAEGKYQGLPAGDGGESDRELRELIRRNTEAMQGLMNLTVYASIETIERERDNYIKMKETRGL